MRIGPALSTCLGVVAALAAMGERDARACGGCLQPPVEVESVITDERMIFSISKDQTTLYDEIEYSGSPASFAWVLPIKGTVTVGVSEDILFATLDQLTATQVLEPTPNCPVTDCFGEGSTGSGGDGSSGSGGDGGGGGVVVIAQRVVGPYETVQLKSTDGSALTNWLHSHGYVVPASDAPVIAAYVKEHFDFLALKLVPGAGVQAMQPVRVTSKGAAPSLPLHMVAVGTGATTGITIWVVADGRWEPQNFPTFTISDSELVWDWSTDSSNYETLRLSKEAALGGRGWQIESSLELSQYAIQNTLSSGSEYDGEGGYYTPADAGDAEAATQDLAVLFAGISGPNVRVTRMRSDVAHASLSVDMTLKASSDTSELTNVHTPAKQIGPPPCACRGFGDDDDGGSLGSGGSDRDTVDSAGGCNTTSSSNTTDVTSVLFACAGAVAIFRSRRRRGSSGP